MVMLPIIFVEDLGVQLLRCSEILAMHCYTAAAWQGRWLIFSWWEMAGVSDCSTVAYPLSLHVVGEDYHLLVSALRRYHSKCTTMQIYSSQDNINSYNLFSQTLSLDHFFGGFVCLLPIPSALTLTGLRIERQINQALHLHVLGRRTCT